MIRKPWVLWMEVKRHNCDATVYVKDFTSAVFDPRSAKRFVSEAEARQYKENHDDHLWAFEPKFIPEEKENGQEKF